MYLKEISECNFAHLLVCSCLELNTEISIEMCICRLVINYLTVTHPTSTRNLKAQHNKKYI